MLDTKENTFGDSTEKLLSHFADLIESQLGLLYQSRKLETMLESLGDIQEGFKSEEETTKDAIITADGNGNITFWSRPAELLFGYTAVEVRGKPLTLIMAERFRKDYQNEIKQAVSSEGANLDRKTIQWFCQ